MRVEVAESFLFFFCLPFGNGQCKDSEGLKLSWTQWRS